MNIWKRIKQIFIKPKPVELTDTQMKNIESICNLYHGAVRKYGDDGHDQFVELLKRLEK
jgi:hypothetical protein